MMVPIANIFVQNFFRTLCGRTKLADGKEVHSIGKLNLAQLKVLILTLLYVFYYVIMQNNVSISL